MRYNEPLKVWTGVRLTTSGVHGYLV